MCDLQEELLAKATVKIDAAAKNKLYGKGCANCGRAPGDVAGSNPATKLLACSKCHVTK